MTRTLLAGKIHRAAVTEVNVDKVQVLDITNGARVETYAIEGERGSGEVCVNGAAGHLIGERDLVIVLHFVQVQDEKAPRFEPKIVRVDARNHIAFEQRPVQSYAGRQVPRPMGAAGRAR